MESLIGRDIGKYHIVEQLGEGGMAVVYKAYDTTLERYVAIKFIRKDAIASQFHESTMARFEREAKALAKLKHPNIVVIIDFGQYEGAPYMVMDFIPCGALRTSGQPMPYRQAARLLTPIASALEFAHLKNIIHRDIKPSNILICENGDPVLSDFGIAKILDDTTDGSLTRGLPIGTPEYMAPEQWAGRPTAQSDIYGLGMVFYYLITGRLPYAAETPQAVMYKQATEPLPRPRIYVPDLPDEVERVIFKALAPKVENRYASMGEFAAALERLSRGQSLPLLEFMEQPPVPPPEEPKPVQQQPQIRLHTGVVVPEVGIKTEHSPLPVSESPPPRPTPPTPAARSALKGAGLQSAAIDTMPRLSRQGVLGRWGWPVIITVGIGGLALVAGVGLVMWFAIIAPGLKATATPLAALSASSTPVLNLSISQTPALTETITLTMTSTYTLAPTVTPRPPTETPKPALGIGSTQVSPRDQMVMVYVPEGNFLMGSDKSVDSNAYNEELPQHMVYLDAFWIDKTLVTNAQYALCVSVGKCIPPHESSSYTHSSYYGASAYADYPVIKVDWNQASAYCSWAGRKLPTEAEWEKAARGTDGRIYPWGNQAVAGNLLNFADKNTSFSYSDKTIDDGYQDTSPVGNYPDGASPYGALDMAGNVWEWVADWYSADYYQASPKSNPTGPASGDYRVLRGGSWSVDGRDVRAANRGRNTSGSWSVNFGFRCAGSS